MLVILHYKTFTTYYKGSPIQSMKEKYQNKPNLTMKHFDTHLTTSNL